MELFIIILCSLFMHQHYKLHRKSYIYRLTATLENVKEPHQGASGRL